MKILLLLVTCGLIVYLLMGKNSPLPTSASKAEQFQQAVQGAKDIQKNMEKRDKLYGEYMQ